MNTRPDTDTGDMGASNGAWCLLVGKDADLPGRISACLSGSGLILREARDEAGCRMALAGLRGRGTIILDARSGLASHVAAPAVRRRLPVVVLLDPLHAGTSGVPLQDLHGTVYLDRDASPLSILMTIQSLIAETRDIASPPAPRNPAHPSGPTSTDLRLREMQHRTKNTLAMVASLVEAGILGARTAEARESLMTLHGRIMGLSHLHRMLWECEGTVSLDSYLGAICGLHQDNCFRDICGSRIETDLEAVCLESTAMAHLGLMVNEALTNALKYGMVTGHEGLVRVSARIYGDSLQVAVEDDGPGIREEGMGNGGFGLELIRELARQMGGKVSVESRRGTRIEIIVPLHRNAAGPSRYGVHGLVEPGHRVH